jgi:hypothetical protein
MLQIETLDKKNIIDFKVNYEQCNPEIKTSHELCMTGLWVLENFLPPKQCDEILENLKSTNFVSFDKMYSKDVRDSERCICFDETNMLTEHLEDKLCDMLEELNENCIPYGFGTERVNWETKGKCNPCLRFNKYNEGSKGFAYHRDSQYVNSAYLRSAWSLVIYLTDCDSGTAFLDTTDGSEKIVSNIKGRAVIFDQRLHHRGLPVLSGTKVVLRTDVLAYSTEIIHLTPDEQRLKDLTIMLFRQAQYAELAAINSDTLSVEINCEESASAGGLDEPQKIIEESSKELRDLASELYEAVIDLRIDGSHPDIAALTSKACLFLPANIDIAPLIKFVGRSGYQSLFKFESHSGFAFNLLKVATLYCLTMSTNAIRAEDTKWKAIVKRYLDIDPRVLEIENVDEEFHGEDCLLSYDVGQLIEESPPLDIDELTTKPKGTGVFHKVEGTRKVVSDNCDLHSGEEGEFNKSKWSTVIQWDRLAFNIRFDDLKGTITTELPEKVFNHAACSCTCPRDPIEYEEEIQYSKLVVFSYDFEIIEQHLYLTQIPKVEL